MGMDERILQVLSSGARALAKFTNTLTVIKSGRKMLVHKYLTER